MPSILLSGPAGGAKSQEARRLLAENDGPAVAADFQSLFVALRLLLRNPVTGLYPTRTDADGVFLPLTEYARRVIISGARARGIDVIATNSSGSPALRRELLDLLGDGATERIIDPGEDVVRGRLADPATGEVGPECSEAVDRWYRRL